MLSSLVLSAYFVYLVLVEYKVNYYYAAIAAFGITVLNPQIYRFLGHLALSYSFFIPLTWYLYIRYTKTVKKFEWSIVIMINILFWYFIHAYMGMILVAFLFSANVFQILITERESLKNWKRYMQLSLQTIVPLLIFWVFALVTDTHVGRTTNPFGFMEYISNFDSVFFPSKAPFFDFFNLRFKIIQIWEGLAYVGVGSILLVTIYFGRLIMKKWRGEALNLSQTKNKELLFVLLPASVLVLLVSFGWPFVFGLEDLLDAFPVIKNFRGVGRFSWVFFNLFTVASVFFF